MKANYIAAVMFTVILALPGCTENQEYELLTGDMIGYVRVLSTAQTEVDDREGVTVTADNGVRLITVTTDESGRYIISGMKTGSYNLTYSKPGYCKYMKPSVQFIGGDAPYNPGRIDLYALPDMSISNLILADISPMEYDVFLQLQYTTTGQVAGGTRYARYYMGKGRDVSYMNYLSTGYLPTSSTPGTRTLTWLLEREEYPVGSEVSFIIYPAAEYNKLYYDAETGLAIYTSINPAGASNILTITVPAK